MKKIGLIVNPVAGMGGSVGLKGTDDGMHIQAIALGAKPVTPAQTAAFLSALKKSAQITFLAAPGKMGADYLTDAGLPCQIVGEIGQDTTAADTIRIAQEMADEGVELLVFVGGDGTARNIHDAIGNRVPVVAVPSGVKVFSAVFAVSARGAAGIVDAFVDGTGFTEEEVLDIDEEAFRDNHLSARLYGTLKVPDVRSLIQHGKEASRATASNQEAQLDISDTLSEKIDTDTLYLLGAGSTLKAITDEIGISKTLLGIDALFNGRLIGKDLNEHDLLDLLERYPNRKIIVTPIGGNGFIFGRGTRQFSPAVLQRVGKENILVVATPDKLSRLDCLRVDTGDIATDQMLSGYMQVIVGYRETRMMKVVG